MTHYTPLKRSSSMESDTLLNISQISQYTKFLKRKFSKLSSHINKLKSTSTYTST